VRLGNGTLKICSGPQNKKEEIDPSLRLRQEMMRIQKRKRKRKVFQVREEILHRKDKILVLLEMLLEILETIQIFLRILLVEICPGLKNEIGNFLHPQMMVKFLDSCPIRLTIFVGILPGVLSSLLRNGEIFLGRGLSGLAKNYLPQRFHGNQSYSLLFGRLGIVRSDVRTIHTPEEVDGKAALLPMSFFLRSIGPR
tara:strand:+ start:7543 stop:8133 length:591 start_codon:yes stop_codon:yes gene_type:complete